MVDYGLLVMVVSVVCSVVVVGLWRRWFQKICGRYGKNEGERINNVLYCK